LAEALMPGTRNAVSVCNDFPEFAVFFVLEVLLMRIPTILGGFYNNR